MFQEEGHQFCPRSVAVVFYHGGGGGSDDDDGFRMAVDLGLASGECLLSSLSLSLQRQSLPGNRYLDFVLGRCKLTDGKTLGDIHRYTQTGRQTDGKKAKAG